MTTKIRLGATGPDVFPLGLGCMGMSGVYGPADEDESIAAIHEAIERGVTLIDTGDFYGMGHNEMLIGRALRGRRERVQLSVKFGALRGPDGSWMGFDGRPQAVKNFCAYSLKRLGVDVIDVYRPARLDPNVPIEDTVGAIADLVKAGYVKHVALSEVGVETIRRAVAVHPIVDVQIEHAIVSRSAEEKIFPVLLELGLSATLYGLLSRGLLAGRSVTTPSDSRAHFPRFAAEARATNDALVGVFAGFAKERGMTPTQLAIAYTRAKVPAFVPVIGAKTRAQVIDALGGLTHGLTEGDVAALEALVPATAIAGTRYGAVAMKQLDSER